MNKAGCPSGSVDILGTEKCLPQREMCLPLMIACYLQRRQRTS